MSTKHIASIKVKKETSFGSLSATTNLPDSTIFATGIQLEAERADLQTYGEIAMNERAEARSGFYQLPPEPETVLDGAGIVQQRRTGTLSFSMVYRGGGDFNALGNGYDGSAISWLLESGLEAGDSPALVANYDNVVTASATANDFTGTGTGKFRVGDIIAFDLNGKREYSAITEITAGVNDTIYYSPQFSQQLQANDTIRTVRTEFGLDADVGASVAFQVDGDDWRTNAYGCRMESVEFSLTGKRLMLTFTFQCALLQSDNSAASPGDPFRLRGKVAHFFPSEVVVSAAVPKPVLGAAPAAADFRLARGDTFDVDEFTCTISNSLAPRGYSESILGMSDLEVTDRTVEVNLTLSVPSSVVADDFKNQVERQLVVGFGPTGAGNGLCLFLPSGVLRTDPNLRDLGGDIVRQVLTYVPGLWNGDQGVAIGTAKNSHIRIGLVH
jgi:hypothetical protein